VPLAIATCVDRGLARDREARWQTADQFAMALRGGLVGVTTPDSRAFDATMHAPSTPAPRAQTPPPPPVPTLGPVPDPSTLRTAPPPVVSTASRNERRSSGALVWVATLLAVILAAAGGGALVVWRLMKTATPQSVATIATQTSVPTAATASDTAVAPTAASATATASATTTATPTAMTTATAHAALPGGPSTMGIAFRYPVATGFVHADAVDTFEQSLIPKFQRCRPVHGQPPVLVRVQLMPNEDGNIAIAQPNAPDPGDVDAARCMAAIFKSNANPSTFHPGGIGNVVVEARLDPR
jgi:hypothetical protein